MDNKTAKEIIIEYLFSVMQNELKKCGTTIESVPFDKQPTPDSIKRLDNL